MSSLAPYLVILPSTIKAPRCLLSAAVTRAAGSDSEGSPRSARSRGHEGRWVPVSTRAMNWLPLTRYLQCGEVEQVISWFVSAFRDPGDFGLCGHAVVTDKQDGILSLRDWIVCKALDTVVSLSPLHQLLYVTNSFFSSGRTIILDSFCNFSVLPRIHHLTRSLANRSSLRWEFWLWKCLHFRRFFWEISQYLLWQLSSVRSTCKF